MAVSLLWLRTLTSAPASRSRERIAGLLTADRSCNGVLPHWSPALASAPASSRKATTDESASHAAQCRSVAPYSSRALMSWPAAKQAAICSGLATLTNPSVPQFSQMVGSATTPASFCARGSAPRSSSFCTTVCGAILTKNHLSTRRAEACCQRRRAHSHRPLQLPVQLPWIRRRT